jgi:hypothetical protein
MSCQYLFVLFLSDIGFSHSQRNHLHKSLLMLCLSIFIVNCLYIPFHLIKPEHSSNIFCHLIGFILHYFFLSSFMWMLIMAFVQYLHFVRIFNAHISHFFVKTSIIGWLLPLICPVCVVVVDRSRSYIGQQRCWIDNTILLYGTLLMPVGLIIISNFILFGFILKSICRHRTGIIAHQKDHSKLQLGAALCCFVSIGNRWSLNSLVSIDLSLYVKVVPGCSVSSYLFGQVFFINSFFRFRIHFKAFSSFSFMFIYRKRNENFGKHFSLNVAFGNVSAYSSIIRTRQLSISLVVDASVV